MSLAGLREWAVPGVIAAAETRLIASGFHFGEDDMTRQKHWTEMNMPELTGQRVLITGANSGIGFEAARAMAQRNAHVILACRTESKALAAMARIRSLYPKAQLQFMPLDLGNLQSVRDMAALFFEQYDSLDILVNNAGVMWLPESRTVDGFETQLGTNHLGHFALTGLLLPALLKAPGSRIVTVSSIAHKDGNLHFDDLWLEKGYAKHKAYAQSKLANLVFARELQRRLTQAGCSSLSIAVHPGVSATHLAAPGLEQDGHPLLAKLAHWLMPLIAQGSSKGALPTLYAATSHDAEGGEYYGPGGFYEFYGYPVKATSTGRSQKPEWGKQLWEISEKLTGVQYDFQVAPQ